MTRKGPRARAGVACLVRTTRPKLMLCDTVYRFQCENPSFRPSSSSRLILPTLSPKSIVEKPE